MSNGQEALRTLIGTSAVATALLAATAPCIGQNTAHRSSANTLLLIPEAAVHGADLKRGFQATLALRLRELFRGENRFQVIQFSANEPSVERAIRENTIQAADVINAGDSGAQQRIADAIGAQYIFWFNPQKDRNGITTSIRFQSEAAIGVWQTDLAQDVAAPSKIQKKKLTQDEMAALTAQAVAADLQIPYRLPASLKRFNHKTVVQVAQAKIIKTPAGNAPPATPPSKSPPPDGPPVGPATSVTAPPATTITPPNSVHPLGPPVLPPAQQPTPPTTPSIQIDPHTGAPATPAEDPTALAVRYRQTGDTANVIVALRRAINDKPMDVGLRQQLVQAYLDRNMPDSAVAEVKRAIALSPTNPGLQRAYGQALLAGGNVTQATAVFQAAAAANPTDVSLKVALGDTELAQDQFDAAIQTYLDASKLDPKSPLPWSRLAHTYLLKAASDLTQYPRSIDAVQKERSLLPPADTETWLKAYKSLVKVITARERDLITELQSDLAAATSGAHTQNDLLRFASDLHDRAFAAADYLDKLPAAAGLDVAQAHYQQGAQIALQTVDMFRNYLKAPIADQVNDIQSSAVDALRELTAGDARLSPPAPGADSGVTTTHD
ncbi:MAG: tetratricopeptide repeat protein [Armatimonadetes bacterium]|nr:tetratricopeptide repeat protein [Armatimonadota bacterium]MDE2206763.1 tetratricopeptide repeat protein [Armatimonadota bacterium]